MYEEWSEVARVEMPRRVDLIRLGLTKRRRGGKTVEPEVEDAVRPVLAEPPAQAPAPTEVPKPTNGASTGARPLFAVPEGPLPPVP